MEKFPQKGGNVKIELDSILNTDYQHIVNY